MPLSRERKLYASMLGLVCVAFIGDRLFLSGDTLGPHAAGAAVPDPAPAATAAPAPAAPRAEAPSRPEKPLSTRLFALQQQLESYPSPDLFHASTSGAGWLAEPETKKAEAAPATKSELVQFAAAH